MGALLARTEVANSAKNSSMNNRRNFMGASAALLAAATLGRAATQEKAARPLRLLFLGGTGFIGPHQIRHALERGHEVTMFNRGRRGGMYGKKVEELIGDRDAKVGEGLKSLEGDRTWDVVIDNSGYVPRHVRDSAELLKDRCGRYLFTSTVAVYDFDRAPGGVCDRDGPLLAAPSPATEEVNGETYGPLKAECDRIVREVYGERATCVRPSYIVGPGDSSDRFTYWVERLRLGGDTVCPALPEQAVQWIDVRDLCHWLIRLAEAGTPGAFNGAGPASSMTNEQLMWSLRAFGAEPTTLHWPTVELLDELKYPTPMFTRDGQYTTDPSHSWGAGLTYRSLAETATDIHAWWKSQPEERRKNPRGWPTSEQEATVLARMKR